jgi:hypothetical protein
MRKTLGRLAPAVVALSIVGALAGCSGGAAAKDTPTPTPTPSVATEAEVASVIAKYEGDWKSTIENASSCRLQYTLDPTGLKSMACYIDEKTMGITTLTAAQALDALAVPDSMTSLVDDTTAILNKISGVDLAVACGDDTTPEDSDACTAAQGQLYPLYLQLGQELDAWAPYM